MQFMIIEKFKPGRIVELYRRFDEKGRLQPDGVTYINSWINEEVTICYQLMEAQHPALIDEWISQWDDLADFEVIPIISSAAAKAKVLSNA